MSVHRSSFPSADPLEGLRITVAPEFFEAVAQRAAEIVGEHQASAEDGWLRGAEAIASYIGSRPSRVYSLSSCHPPRIPIHRDGSAFVARRSELDAWVRNGGGKRP